jgi:hypothetical protein
MQRTIFFSFEQIQSQTFQILIRALIASPV